MVECSSTLTINNVGILTSNMVKSCELIAASIFFSGDVQIQSNTFYSNSLAWNQLVSIDFGPGNVQIGSTSFRNCKSLESVTFSPLTTFVFSGNPFASSAQNIQFHLNGNSKFWLYDECLYHEDGLVCIPSRLSNVTVPANVTRLAALAGYECALLLHVELQAQPTTCGIAVFMYTPLRTVVGASMGGKMLIVRNSITWASPDLTGDIVIPEGVVSCSFGAIFRCTQIESLIFPRSMSTVAGSAFSECTNLKALVFHSKVAFSSDTFYAASVTTVKFKRAEVSGFYDFPSLERIELGCGVSLEAFKGMEHKIVFECTKKFSQIIRALPHVIRACILFFLV